MSRKKIKYKQNRKRHDHWKMKWKQKLEYRNAHYPGVSQFIIKSVEESTDNLHPSNLWVTSVQK